MEIPTHFKNFGFEQKNEAHLCFVFLGTCGDQVAGSMIEFWALSYLVHKSSAGCEMHLTVLGTEGNGSTERLSALGI